MEGDLYWNQPPGGQPDVLASPLGILFCRPSLHTGVLMNERINSRLCSVLLLLVWLLIWGRRRTIWLQRCQQKCPWKQMGVVVSVTSLNIEKVYTDIQTILSCNLSWTITDFCCRNQTTSPCEDTNLYKASSIMECCQKASSRQQ